MDEHLGFGELLARFLQERDRSASWLAQRLKLHPSTISRWLSNETTPDSPYTVRQIADVLGIRDHPHTPWLQRLLVASGFGYISYDATPPVTESPVATFHNSVGSNYGNLVLGYGDIHSGDIQITQDLSPQSIVEGIHLFKQQLQHAFNSGLDGQVANATFEAVTVVEQQVLEQRGESGVLLEHINYARTLLLEQMQNAATRHLITPLITQLDQVALHFRT